MFTVTAAFNFRIDDVHLIPFKVIRIIVKGKKVKVLKNYEQNTVSKLKGVYYASRFMSSL